MKTSITIPTIVIKQRLNTHARNNTDLDCLRENLNNESEDEFLQTDDGIIFDTKSVKTSFKKEKKILNIKQIRDGKSNDFK